MYNKIIGIVKYPFRFILLLLYSRPKWLIILFINRKELCFHESYFPEEKRKSNFRIFMDQAIQVLKYGYANDYYFPYGFDVKSKKQIDEYLHYAPFRARRDARNVKVHSSTAVLRDKLLFGMFTSYYGVSSIENLAIITNGRLFNLETKKYQPIKEFFTNLDNNTSLKFD